MRRRFGLSIGIACIGLLASGIGLARASEPLLGKAAANFCLADSTGKQHCLADWKDAQAVAIVFLGTECPLARLYASRLGELAKQYAERGVQLVGIDANVQDTPEEMAAFVRDTGLPIPLLKDAENRLADQFGATRTPEVFLLDAQRVVRYHGRIDDQYVVGTKKSQIGRRDLALAIDELLDGKPVSQPELPITGCFIGRVTEPRAGEVTYSKQIARIFQNRCVECHRQGEIGPFSLASYQDAIGWGETIREVVDQQRMPPWFADPHYGKFLNDSRMSAEEKSLIATWVKDGCPEGDPQDLPPARKFVEGWNIPRPDMIVKMSDESFHVPAEGVVDYKHFVVDPGFKEDKWIVASEARPGNRSVVHHILVFLQPPGEQPELLRGSLLAAFAPGSPPHQAQSGMAKRIPAGSKIIFQMHYTTNGTAQDDISSLGLVFCDEKDVRQRIDSGWAVNFVFSIPPGDKDYKVVSQHRFGADRLLLSLTPHMHVRGKSFKYEAVYPDKTREVLLDVPHWDFNWQLDYILSEPKLMPKGTVLRCEAHYDNSAANPANPDPAKQVGWGDQTWEEMMIGWFTACTLPSDAQVSQAKNTVER